MIFNGFSGRGDSEPVKDGTGTEIITYHNRVTNSAIGWTLKRSSPRKRGNTKKLHALA